MRQPAPAGRLMARQRPIPEPIYRRMLAWLDAGGTGTIALHARAGKILEAEFPGERVRYDDPVLESPQP